MYAPALTILSKHKNLGFLIHNSAKGLHFSAFIDFEILTNSYTVFDIIIIIHVLLHDREGNMGKSLAESAILGLDS